MNKTENQNKFIDIFKNSSNETSKTIFKVFETHNNKNKKDTIANVNKSIFEDHELKPIK